MSVAKQSTILMASSTTKDEIAGVEEGATLFLKISLPRWGRACPVHGEPVSDTGVRDGALCRSVERYNMLESVSGFWLSLGMTTYFGGNVILPSCHCRA